MPTENAKRLKKYNPNYHRTHLVDMTNIRLGGGAYSILQQSKLNPQPLKTTPPSKDVERIKRKLGANMNIWQYLCDMYNFTSDEYFEIAKFMTKSYSYLMDTVIRHLRVDKLSADQYYEICKIMAANGVFYNVEYQKLMQAKPEKVKNPLYQIMMTALVQSVFGYYSREAITAPQILQVIREHPDYFEPHEKYALFFALWVFMKPRHDDINISCNDLAGITDHTVKYVKDIIIKEIYKAPNSDFVKRLNFVSNLIDENNGMPKNVNDASRQIIIAIHDTGRTRLVKEFDRNEEREREHG